MDSGVKRAHVTAVAVAWIPSSRFALGVQHGFITSLRSGVSYGSCPWSEPVAPPHHLEPPYALEHLEDRGPHADPTVSALHTARTLTAEINPPDARQHKANLL